MRERPDCRPLSLSKYQWLGLDGSDIHRLGPLLALGDFELDLLPLIQGAVPISLNRAVVYEEVFRPVVGCDEPITLLRAEPLD